MEADRTLVWGNTNLLTAYIRATVQLVLVSILLVLFSF